VVEDAQRWFFAIHTHRFVVYPMQCPSNGSEWSDSVRSIQIWHLVICVPLNFSIVFKLRICIHSLLPNTRIDRSIALSVGIIYHSEGYLVCCTSCHNYITTVTFNVGTIVIFGLWIFYRYFILLLSLLSLNYLSGWRRAALILRDSYAPRRALSDAMPHERIGVERQCA